MLKVVQCYTTGGDGIRKLCENGVGGSGGGSLMQKLVYEKMEVSGDISKIGWKMGGGVISLFPGFHMCGEGQEIHV